MQLEWEKGRWKHCFSPLFPPLPSQKEKEEKASSLGAILYMHQAEQKAMCKESLPSQHEVSWNGMLWLQVLWGASLGTDPLLVWGCGLILSTFGQHSKDELLLFFIPSACFAVSHVFENHTTTDNKNFINYIKAGKWANLFQQGSEIYLSMLISNTVG